MRKTLCFFVILLLLLTVLFFSLFFFPKEKETEENISEPEEIIIENEKRIEIEALCQYPELPTGCEITAAATVLRYYGLDITMTTLANMVEKGDFYYRWGNLYGPDPREVFVGDPFTNSGYGCFSEVIAKAVEKINGFGAEVLKDKSVAELCRDYITDGKPLLLWVTMGMREPYDGTRWTIYDKDEFVWPACEHCMVLCGYTEDYYCLADPQSGTVVMYEKELVEKRFSSMGSQAVYIYEK